MKKLMVLIKKDIREAVTEKTSLLMLLTAPVLYLVLSLFVGDQENILPYKYMFLMCTLFQIGLVPICLFPLLIGEEKEKNTLPILWKAGVGKGQFLAAKAVASMILLLLSGGVLFGMARIPISYLPLYLICILLSGASVLPIGGIIGILGADKNSVNVYATVPVIFVMVVPVFTFSSEGILYGASAFLPTGLFTDVFFMFLLGNEVAGIKALARIGVCVLYGAAGSIIFWRCYKKYGLKSKALEMR